MGAVEQFIYGDPSDKFNSALRELQRFTYKPDWNLQVLPPYPYEDEIFLKVTFKAEDTYNPGKWIDVTGKFVMRLTSYATEFDPERFAMDLERIIQEVERHESREWLKRDGVAYNDPHKNT